MNKLALMKEELKGLDVEFFRHYADEGFTQAKINGHSIIWHQYAYCDHDQPNVEVYFRNANDVEGYVPIKGLRKRVM